MSDWPVYPTVHHQVTCGFWCYPFHFANDLNAWFETVRAVLPGVVITVDRTVVFGEREGMYVEIRHEGRWAGWISRYFHLSRIDVVVGQHVHQGDQIAISGNTGYYVDKGVVTQYAPHLHLALGAPTKAAALAVFDNPQLTGYGWSVDAVWIIEHPPEEGDMTSEEHERDLEIWGMLRFITGGGDNRYLGEAAAIVRDAFQGAADASTGELKMGFAAGAARAGAIANAQAEQVKIQDESAKPWYVPDGVGWRGTKPTD